MLQMGKNDIYKDKMANGYTAILSEPELCTAPHSPHDTVKKEGKEQDTSFLRPLQLGA